MWDDPLTYTALGGLVWWDSWVHDVTWEMLEITRHQVTLFRNLRFSDNSHKPRVAMFATLRSASGRTGKLTAVSRPLLLVCTIPICIMVLSRPLNCERNDLPRECSGHHMATDCGDTAHLYIKLTPEFLHEKLPALFMQHVCEQASLFDEVNKPVVSWPEMTTVNCCYLLLFSRAWIWIRKWEMSIKGS